MTVLITNGANTHPPETWAMATAQTIFNVNTAVDGGNRVAALKLQASVAEFLVGHHAQVQADEQAALDADSARFAAEHDVDRYLDDVVAGIVSLAASTPWADIVNAPDMEVQIRSVIGNHFATAQHIHRQAHARANPHIDEGRVFLASLTSTEA